jgi:hypothetical protein
MNQRAIKLNAALLHEFFRAKLEFAYSEKPSARANELEAHIEVMRAVLNEDNRLEQLEADAARAKASAEVVEMPKPPADLPSAAE